MKPGSAAPGIGDHTLYIYISTPGDKKVQEKSLGLFGVIAVPHLHVQGAAVGCAGFVAESGNDCALLNTAPPF